MKAAVLFVSHFINESYIQRYFKLVNDLEGQCDVYWFFQTDNGISDEPLRERGVNVEGFTIEDLNALDYSPMYEILYGSEHFFPQYFHSRHPDYDYYWMVEYDVVFTGNWRVLFDAFRDNDADMLASHIALHSEENKYWEWWKNLSFDPLEHITPDRWVKSFNPIHRLSRRAIEFLDVFLKREGNHGSNEAVPVTALYNNGFRLEDFGGTGEFVSPSNKNRFYLQHEGIHNGTMRWRPEFRLAEIGDYGIKDKLFHPVKE